MIFINHIINYIISKRDVLILVSWRVLLIMSKLDPRKNALTNNNHWANFNQTWHKAPLGDFCKHMDISILKKEIIIFTYVHQF